MTLLLPVTLCTVAALALVNIWLSVRIGAVRRAAKVSVGDGGNEVLTRRMRAQLNLAENAPLVALLIAGLEIAGIGAAWLAWVAAAFVIGRVLHGFGMDGGKMSWGRPAGTGITLIAQLFLAGVAVGVVLQRLG